MQTGRSRINLIRLKGGGPLCTLRIIAQHPANHNRQGPAASPCINTCSQSVGEQRCLHSLLTSVYYRELSLPADGINGWPGGAEPAHRKQWNVTHVLVSTIAPSACWQFQQCLCRSARQWSNNEAFHALISGVFKSRLRDPDLARTCRINVPSSMTHSL